MNIPVENRDNRNEPMQFIINCSLLLSALIGLYYTTRVNFLLFHSLAEIFSIVVAFSIFVIAWNSKKHIRNPYLLFIGIAYLFIAVLDLLHTLSYKGMPIFSSYDFYANELWVAARYMESVSLLLAFIFLDRDMVPKTNLVFVVYAVITAILVTSIFYWKIFPVCFVEGSGLTPFKKISEYVICTILLMTLFFLQKNRQKFEKKVFLCLLLSVICTIVSELAFSAYISNYGFANIIGHYFKIFSFFLIYEAIIKTGVEKPFELIFRDLDRANQDLSRQAIELTAKNAQIENEKRLLNAVLDALPIGVAITDKSGGVLRTNKVYEKIWGGPRPETISVEDYSSYKAWWGDTNQPVAPEQWASAIAIREGRESLGQMMRLQRFDGTEVMVINSASPVCDNTGTVVGSAVAIQDITELKKTEKALYESEQRLRLFIEHAPVAIAMFDRKMRYLSASRRWLKDYGLADRDLSGLSHYDIFDSTERRREDHRRGLAGEVLEIENDSYQLSDGSVRWLRRQIRPWYDMSGEIGGIVIFTEDITVRKHAEEQLKTLNNELERRVEQRTLELKKAQSDYLHAEKLSAIGKLSASIAHEFNSPLQGVITTLKGLKRRAILDDEDKELLDLTIAENERMKNLVRSLQDFNRPSTGKKEMMDVHASIDSLLLLYKSDFNKKMISVEQNYALVLPLIQVIPDQIKQVFLNLLNNAVDAIGPSGGIISINTSAYGKRIAIVFKDSGMGIRPENIDQIFQPFYTTKSEGMGTGLGLSVCQEIIQKHGGVIQVESNPGIGSTFTVFLPIQQAESAS